MPKLLTTHRNDWGEIEVSNLSIVQAYLIGKAPEIAKQQGFLKNEEDIKRVIRYLERSFVPRKYLSDPKLFKPAQKLLCSLKRYVHKIGNFFVDRFTFRYQNIFHDYKLLDPVPDREHNLKDFLQVDSDVPISTSSYSKVKTFQIDEGSDFLKQKNEYQKIVEIMTKGHKRVDKKVFYRIKLKKKYQTKEELRRDLFKIYQNWYLSKKRNRETYILIREKFEEAGSLNTQNVLDNVMSKYFISFDLFNQWMDKDSYPKRFSRIMKTCKAIELGKHIKNNTVIDSIISDIVLLNDKGKKSYFRETPVNYRFRFNAKFAVFYRSICNDMINRGYLTRSDFYQRGEPGDYITNIHDFPPVYRKNLTRYFQVQKAKIIDGIICKFFDDKDLSRLFPKIKRIIKLKTSDPDFVNKLRSDMISRGYLSDEELLKVDDLVDSDKLSQIQSTDEMVRFLKTAGMSRIDEPAISEMRMLLGDVRVSEKAKKIITGKIYLACHNHIITHKCDLEYCEKFEKTYTSNLSEIAEKDKGRKLSKSDRRNLFGEKGATLNALRYFTLSHYKEYISDLDT